MTKTMTTMRMRMMTKTTKSSHRNRLHVSRDIGNLHIFCCRSAHIAVFCEIAVPIGFCIIRTLRLLPFKTHCSATLPSIQIDHPRVLFFWHGIG